MHQNAMQFEYNVNSSDYSCNNLNNVSNRKIWRVRYLELSLSEYQKWAALTFFGMSKNVMKYINVCHCVIPFWS